MYRDSYQRGLLSIFFSGGSKPLEIWETKTKDGYVKRFLDPEIKTMVLEIRGANISTTYMICPKGKQVLGITMPFLVMIVKNLMKYFSFEVTILDETGTRRRFRVSNFQSTTQILPLCTVMPIGLSPGWNQIQFNLAEFTRRAYRKQFVEVQKLKINANIRLRRIYFTEKLMAEDDLPAEYKLYFPLQQKGPQNVKVLNTNKENIKTPPQEETQERKISSTHSTRLGSKIISATVVKKSMQSLQIISTHDPEGIQKGIENKPVHATQDESEVGGDHPQKEEMLEDSHRRPTNENQATEQEQTVSGHDPDMEERYSVESTTSVEKSLSKSESEEQQDDRGESKEEPRNAASLAE